MASRNLSNGQTLPNSSTKPQLPSWNAAALLNPKGFVPALAKSRSPSLSPSHPTAPAPNGLNFEFSSPSANAGFHAHPPRTASSGASTPNPHTPTQNGMSSMIERMNNVQDRSSVPAVKRRRLETDRDDQSTDNTSYCSRGSGMLGDYVRQRVEDGDMAPSPAHVVAVDLTEDDDELNVATPSSVAVESVDLTAEDETAPALDQQDEEVCYGMVEGATINCHIVPAPKPGMKAMADGYWPQVKVVLRRTVGDRTNTIQVYDYTRKIVGSIDSKTAAGLVPLLDSRLVGLRTDCIIGLRRIRPDEEVGNPISRSYKVSLMLYGRQKLAFKIGRHLLHHGLKLLSPMRVDKGIRVFNPLAKENRIVNTPRQVPIHDRGPILAASKTAEEVRSDVLTVFDALPRSDTLPECEPHGHIKTALLKHQKQALYFMMGRENATSSESANGIWQQKQGNNGQIFYHNVVTNTDYRHLPPPTLGGILADMMGLGKTLSILSLVVTTLDDGKRWEDSAPAQYRPLVEKKQASQFQPPRPQAFPLTELKRNSRATLLVCPLSVVSNWEEQVKQHVEKDGLSYHIYHGPNRIKDPNLLADFDLVITTYGSVSTEVSSRARGGVGQHPLEEIGWFRIVLDEAHQIRTQATLGFKAICRLQANRRWAVTGTPVQNRLEDLGALLAFLRLKPFDDRSKFAQYIVTPFKMADPEIVPKLRVLVDTITLRRLKDKIDLPKRHDEVVMLEFSDDERRMYDAFEKNARDRLNALAGQEDRLRGGKTYIHILQSIMRLRLFCAHGKDLLSDKDMAMLEGLTQDSAIDLDSDEDEEKPPIDEKTAYEMYNLIKQTNQDDCIECKRRIGSEESTSIQSERQEDVLGFITPCFHLLCTSCLDSFKDETTGASHKNRAYGSCPYCHVYEKFGCVELRASRAEDEQDTSTKANAAKSSGKGCEQYSGPHTKTKYLVGELMKLKDESSKHPGEPCLKSVVFSCWTSHLDLIKRALDHNEIVSTRLDGKMSLSARSKAIERFREDPLVQVMLVSIGAGGLGLNLTAATSAFIMEPQFNPAAEAQAVERVHRLGQKRDVRCVRLVMKDSFEEKMRELQDKKIKLASLSMDREGGREGIVSRSDAAKQRLMDLRSLFK